MAIFIPSIKPEDFNNSYGEMKVYEALRSLGDQYVVFYSMSWVGVNDKRSLGEADFVICHPELGILVVEVKSGEIGYQDGYWIQTNTKSRERKRIDPLVQARKSQFEILDRLHQADLNFRLPLLCYCAWFPSVNIPAATPLPPEASREIIFDCESLENPEKAIEKCFSYWRRKHSNSRLDKDQFQKVIEVLCPHFHVIPKLKTQMEELETSYIQLTHQQIALLDFLEEQKTAVIHGLAGTGKTVLAVEKARRLASQRESVLYLCYNSYLRDTLRDNNSIPNVTFHNIHSLAYEVLGYPELSVDEIIPAFYKYLENILDFEKWGYSNVIIDEGQDLEDRFLDQLYKITKKKHGCFYVFYDRNQYVLKNAVPHWIENAECKLVLHKNCRNTAEVFRTSCRIIGLNDVSYNDIHGEVPAVRFYKTQNDFDAIVSDFTSKMITEGLLPEDMVVLTAKTLDQSWVNIDHEYSGVRLSTEREKGKVFFTTIRKFKGLEAKAILIVDFAMSALVSPDEQRLLYVGSSRAKDLLNIAMLEDVDSNDMADFIRELAPDRNVPKNKKGLKRLLDVTC